MNIRAMKTTFMMIFAVLVMALSGCSADYLREGYVPPSTRPAAKIPEIRQQVNRPRPALKKVIKSYKPQVQKYSITSSTSTVVTQKEVNAVINRNRDIKKQAAIELDPYASIPENGSSNTSIKKSISVTDSKPVMRKASPAVKSLMMRARADLAVGNTQLAISKLERGLRIESQNPNIWHLLAKAQYGQANHQQAIAMAKKSIRYSDNGQGDNELTSQNWRLIQKAGEKSDDAIAIKEALDYFKVNP